eukprot:PhF_6_TR40955/c1_g1_i1/m.61986
MNNRPEDNDVDNEPILDASAIHDTAIREQDRHLDNLISVIGRNKQIGVTMGNELHEHGVLLEELGDGVDRTTAHIRRQRLRLTHLLEAGIGKGFWLCVFCLVCIIGVLLVLPKAS